MVFTSERAVWLCRWPSARPKNSANTRICKTSLPAMASMMLLGKTWVIKSFRFSAPVFRFSPAADSGSGTFSAWPGCSTLAKIRPMNSEQNEAPMNQPSARLPMRPTERASPMPARPATRVANTSGAMIILIRRRKISVRMLKYEAISLACAGEAARVLQA